MMKYLYGETEKFFSLMMTIGNFFIQVDIGKETKQKFVDEVGADAVLV